MESDRQDTSSTRMKRLRDMHNEARIQSLAMPSYRCFCQCFDVQVIPEVFMEPLYDLYQQTFREVGVGFEAEFEKLLLERNVAEALQQMDRDEASMETQYEDISANIRAAQAHVKAMERDWLQAKVTAIKERIQTRQENIEQLMAANAAKEEHMNKMDGVFQLVQDRAEDVTLPGSSSRSQMETAS